MKVLLSLPEEVVAKLDAAARDIGKSRSALATELLSEHLLRLDRVRLQRASAALRSIEELGRRIPTDFDDVKQIRAERDERGSKWA